MKLLVVEDDPPFQASLLRLLAQWGYATEWASTAAEALAWLERELFDLVLLDLGLPDRDGLSLCRQLRRLSPHQPLVLMLTARESRADKVRGFEEGATTQFTTIFMATAPAFTFPGLLAGTLLGHALVTWLAVGAGKWIGGRISEKLLYRLSGGLVLVFGLFSLKQALA